MTKTFEIVHKCNLLKQTASIDCPSLFFNLLKFSMVVKIPQLDLKITGNGILKTEWAHQIYYL